MPNRRMAAPEAHRSIEMISITDAINITKKNIPAPEMQEYLLEHSVGKYLSKDIHAPEPSPRYTNSAMDGYALRWEDVFEASKENPAVLTVIGESRAGIPLQGRVEKKEAIRISTGAMLTDGCDTVVRVEDTLESNNTLHVLAVKKKGQDIRYKGEEFKVGDLLLHKGTKISAPQAALLASVGVVRVEAYKPCEVAILVTGSELVSAGESIADYQIRDSNMIMLKTAIQEAGGNVVSCLRISDNKQATIDALEQARADIILCTGGVSVGRHDHVKDAAEANDFEPLFWRIQQKPGKPLYFARKEKSLLFGLPGNPVSAFMCFTHYVRPVITTLNGLPFGWPTVSGESADDITNHGKRTNMIRVQLTWRPNGGYCISNTEKQGSHMLTSLSDADGYIILEPGQILKSGERIDVYRYDFRREPV